MKIALFLFFFFQCVSSLYACSCVGDVSQSFPENIREINPPAETIGYGYITGKNETKKVKFLACYNRFDCEDLDLSKYDLKFYRNLNKTPMLFRFQSYFKSFETGLLSDAVANVDVKAKRESVFEKFNIFGCTCPIPYNASISMDDRNEHNQFKKLYVKKYKKELVTIPDKMKGCGCENIIENNGFYSRENYEAEKPEYYYKSKNKMLGFFYEKNEKLYFKKLLGQDFEFYDKNVPNYPYAGPGNIIPKDEITAYENKKRIFHEKIQILEVDAIEIKNKYKCNPITESFLKERVYLTSEKPFNIRNNSLEQLNFCHMTIENFSYSPNRPFKKPNEIVHHKFLPRQKFSKRKPL